MKMVRGVLLDVDGTLLDSNRAHAEAWQRALAEHGLTFDICRLERLIGMGADQMLPVLGLDPDHGPGKAAKKAKDRIFVEVYLPRLKPQRGARRLLELMRDTGLARIVATSSEGCDLTRLLDAAGVRDLIEDAATASDASHSKPDPDVVHAAIERSGLPRESLVMLGDTPYDVAAAMRAGVAIVCVRCGGWSDADLAGALAVYRDPEDIAEHFADSVFAR